MFKKNTILGVVLARGGSKGIPRKNIKVLNGKPLIQYTIDAINDSQYIDSSILSTEDKEIAKIAEGCGIKVPFLRPKNLAKDNSKSVEALIHSTKWFINNRFYPDYVMLFQPTSPLRESKDIDKSIEKLINLEGSSLISLTEADNHPHWMMKISNQKVLPYEKHYFLNKNRYHRRQQLPKIFNINGAIYILETDLLLEDKESWPIWPNTLAYIMPKERSVNIDDWIDWKLAESLLENNYI